MEIGTSGLIETLRERYASTRATGSYAKTLQEYKSWGKSELQPWVQANNGFTMGMVGGKPADFGVQAVQFLPSGADPLASGMSMDAATRAYASGRDLSAQSAQMERFWNSAPGSFKNVSMQSMGIPSSDVIKDIDVRGGPNSPESVRDWRREAYAFLSSYASDHNVEYRQKAEELDISIEGPAFRGHFYQLDGEYGEDLSAGQPKSDAERIFFAMASPEEIAAFQAEMQTFQQPIDEFYAAKADDVARTLQYSKDMLQHNKDLKAAGNWVNEAFSDLGVDRITLSQLRFRPGADGGIQVSGHPQAAEIADAINADAQLSGTIAFAFGFSRNGSGVSA